MPRSVSRNRTGSPAWGVTTSSSRITTWPRMTVAIGQPLASMPSKGVQPERVAMSAWRIVRRAARSTMVRSASIALGHPALARRGRRCAAGRGWSQVDETLEGQATLGHVGQHHRHEGLHPRHARGRGGIGPGLLLARVRRVVGAQHVGHARGDPSPEARAVGRVADRRVHLGEAVQPLIGLRPGQGEVLGRHLDAGDVLVVGPGSRSRRRWSRAGRGCACPAPGQGDQPSGGADGRFGVAHLGMAGPVAGAGQRPALGQAVFVLGMEGGAPADVAQDLRRRPRRRGPAGSRSRRP